MGGRYGGNIRRGKGRSPWRVSHQVLAAIGKASRPDLEAIGRRTRQALKLPPESGEATHG
jgi:hypothetical protein